MKLSWTYNWVMSPKKTTVILLTAFALISAISIVLPSKKLIFLNLALGCTLPTLLIVIWLSSTNCFQTIKNAPWLGVVAAAIVFIYTLFASTWASSQINEHFMVNPDFFPVTSAALTFIHLQATVISEIVINPALFFAIVFFPIIIVFTLMLWPKNGKKLLIILLITPIFTGAFYGFYSGLNQHLPKIIEYIALNSDFNEKFLCNNEEARLAQSVVFLDGSHVLGYFPQFSPEKFKVVPCTYPSSQSH